MLVVASAYLATFASGLKADSYDLRDYGYVSSVKNQNPYGTCWTFATYGAMESEILKSEGVTYDFSENNLANNHGFDLEYNEGGNTWMSIAYLSRLDGPVSEADDPYDQVNRGTGLARQRFLTNSNYYNDVSTIKAALKSTGALATSFYWDEPYYNSVTNSYYYTGDESSNHAVTIVGWDDSKTISVNGNSTTGAWLIKNSWGTGWGNSGYCWIAYDNCADAMSFSTTSADAVKSVYYYDEHGEVGVGGGVDKVCNVFEATTADHLNAVGFYTESDSVSYTVEILSSLNGGEVLATKTGTMDNIGWHVVFLDSLVNIAAGDDFVVSLALGDNSYAFDCALDGFSSTSTANAGESFYWNNTSWVDFTSFESTANFCIKVYGVPEPSSLCLMLVGLAAYGVWRRRRR